jgi:hypothetical protein
VEVLDQLKENLQRSFTVELIESGNKDELLREAGTVESKRRELEAQGTMLYNKYSTIVVTELDKALVTLSKLLSRSK